MFFFLIPIVDVIKVVIASVASVVLLGFAGVTLAGSAVALIVSTPIFIIFSPILVPATIATTLLATGVTASASLGATALGLITWLIRSCFMSKSPFSASVMIKVPKRGKYGKPWKGDKSYPGNFGIKPFPGIAGGYTPPGDPYHGQVAPIDESQSTGDAKWSFNLGPIKPAGGLNWTLFWNEGLPTGEVKWNGTWQGKSYSGIIPIGSPDAGGSTMTSTDVGNKFPND